MQCIREFFNSLKTIFHTEKTWQASPMKWKEDYLSRAKTPHATCFTLMVRIGRGSWRLRYSVDRTRLERYVDKESRKYINEFDQSCFRNVSHWCQRLAHHGPSLMTSRYRISNLDGIGQDGVRGCETLQLHFRFHVMLTFGLKEKFQSSSSVVDHSLSVSDMSLPSSSAALSSCPFSR